MKKFLKKIWFKAGLIIVAIAIIYSAGMDKGRVLEAQHQKAVRTPYAKVTSSVITNGWEFGLGLWNSALAYADVKEAVK